MWRGGWKIRTRSWGVWGRGSMWGDWSVTNCLSRKVLCGDEGTKMNQRKASEEEMAVTTGKRGQCMNSVSA